MADIGVDFVSEIKRCSGTRQINHMAFRRKYVDTILVDRAQVILQVFGITAQLFVPFKDLA
ncbi:hypothetical protein D3C85_1814950 [compost metagenome]